MEVVRLREVFSDSPVDDLLSIDGDVIDLGPVVRDAAVLALPVAPLCGRGLPRSDPDHFPVGTGDGAERAVDPHPVGPRRLRFDPGVPDPLE